MIPVTTGPSSDIPLHTIAGDVHVDMGQPRELPEPPKSERSCWGKVFHDWSQYVLVGTGLLGPGAVLVGLLINNLIVSGVGGLVFFAGGVTVFIRIGCLKPQRDLENEVEFFRRKLSESMLLEDKLNVDINRITRIKDNLESDVEKAKASVEDLKNLLTQDTADFDKITAQIGAFQSQANGLVGLYKKFVDMFVEVRKQRDATQRINKVFQEKIKELGGTIQTFEGNEGDFVQGIEKQDSNVQGILKVNEGLKEQIQELQESKKGLEQQVVSLLQRVGELVQLLRSLDPTIESKGLKDLAAIVAQLEQVTNSME